MHSSIFSFFYFYYIILPWIFTRQNLNLLSLVATPCIQAFYAFLSYESCRSQTLKTANDITAILSPYTHVTLKITACVITERLKSGKISTPVDVETGRHIVIIYICPNLGTYISSGLTFEYCSRTACLPCILQIQLFSKHLERAYNTQES